MTSLSSTAGPAETAKPGAVSIEDRTALLDAAIEETRIGLNAMSDQQEYVESRFIEEWQQRFAVLRAIRADVILAEAYRTSPNLQGRVAKRDVQTKIDLLYTIYSAAGDNFDKALYQRKPITNARRVEPKWQHKIVKRRRRGR